ncbi:Crp/Fnr family transcriptional regulator [Paenibacillus protaetiae]|uniref:Crp/Fnr family transcriptional regulator n=1 Tax=Paenibacillus protaetiae TaxID=2509456 RepID=A0A4P6F620_9BACL|nr:Crp/Fnr family transcriptional regulator [Paenibacillus protaetiae]QAY65838.1 Crp/Fnr family transcriptional regulator [Paenibacillus protaetiae]
MKVSFENDQIESYCNQFQLERMFSDIDSIPLQLRTYEKNELILQEGDDLDGIYLQVKGQTKVTTSVETGKSLLLRFCYPFSIFGDIEIIQKVPIQSQVKALADTCFIFIDKQTVEKSLLNDCRFLNELLHHLSYKLQTCTSASRINLLASVEERFAIYLLTTRQSNDFGREIQSQNIPEIASVIGTTPRHLNRLIQKLSVSGTLSKKRSSFIVLDWNELDRLSNGLRYY